MLLVQTDVIILKMLYFTVYYRLNTNKKKLFFSRKLTIMYKLI